MSVCGKWSCEPYFLLIQKGYLNKARLPIIVNITPAIWLTFGISLNKIHPVTMVTQNLR
jgi:hypothetical protein